LQCRHSQNYTIRTQSTSSQAKIKPTIAIKETVNLVTIEVTMTPVALLQLLVLQHSKAHDFRPNFVVKMLHVSSVLEQRRLMEQLF
jgi:hypothetical protein